MPANEIACRPESVIAGAVHSLMREQKRVMWENLPSPTKKLVFQLVEAEMREGIDSLAADLHDHVERLLDLRELVAIGGCLGAVVGWGQLVLLFGERLLVSGATIG